MRRGLETASYAGQQETFLNVDGAESAETDRRVLGVLLQRARALLPRAKGSLDDLRIAVVVQQMVAPEKSGVLFTVDPVQRRRDRMVVEAVFGLGDQVVSGEVTPDHYAVDRSGSVKRERLANGGVCSPRS